MNKLTNIFDARPIARDAFPFVGGEGAIPVSRRARPTLTYVWTLDPVAGRPVCSARSSAETRDPAAPDFDERSSATRFAA